MRLLSSGLFLTFLSGCGFGVQTGPTGGGNQTQQPSFGMALSLTPGDNVNAGNGGSAVIQFAIMGNPPTLNLTLGNIGCLGSVIASGTSTISNGVKYHVAVTLSGTSVSFFINGVLDSSPTLGASQGNCAYNEASIGAAYAGTAAH